MVEMTVRATTREAGARPPQAKEADAGPLSVNAAANIINALVTIRKMPFYGNELYGAREPLDKLKYTIKYVDVDKAVGMALEMESNGMPKKMIKSAVLEAASELIRDGGVSRAAEALQRFSDAFDIKKQDVIAMVKGIHELSISELSHRELSRE